MDKGSIQAIGIVTIGAVVISGVVTGQIDFAQTIGLIGVGAIAGFLGNEVSSKSETSDTPEA